MPYLLNIITETPEEAVEQAIEDAISRARDVWGLNYSESSDGLYPTGAEIGRTQFRPSHCHLGARPYPESGGGQWRTVFLNKSPPLPLTAPTKMCIGTDAATGWGRWLEFDVDEDSFIVIEGVFSTAPEPSITEFEMKLSGTDLPIIQVEAGLYATEERTLRGYFEVPVVVSPKATAVFNVRSYILGLVESEEDVGEGLCEPWGVLGDVIGKRSFLIKTVY